MTPQRGYQDFEIRRLSELICELEKKGVCGLDRFLRILSERVANRQEYLDVYKEGLFSCTLSRNGFTNICIEFAADGPDIKADFNQQTSYFEVKRRRPNEDDGKYDGVTRAVGSDSDQAIISKIQEKLSQLVEGEINVIVLWSSTVRLNDWDVRNAFDYIKQEIENDRERYCRISGVLFTGEEGINIPTLRQYYLFKNERASQPLDDSLFKKLDSLHTEDPQKLRKRYKHLGA